MMLILLFFFSGVNAVSNPEQVHISYGDDDSHMTVMWSTYNNVKGYVYYGESPNSLTDSEYSEKSVLQSDNWNALKVIHRVKLKNRPVKFLVYGDLGVEDGKITFDKLQEEMSTRQYDAVLHVGDIAYDLHSEGGKVGDMFLNNVENIASRIPYMTSPGNHELQDGFHHYRTRFSMPNTEWPMPKNKLWYSYDIGPVHLISYSTEAFFSDNQFYTCDQFEWLKKDLIQANKNRHKHPWIIAMGHRPMYCSNRDIDDCTGRILGYWVKKGLEDLFYEYGVDLILQAHEHSYERLWPVYDFHVFSNNYINPRAPVHIISGAAGNPWSAFRAAEKSLHSYGRLSVVNKTHLHFEQVMVKDGNILDSIWIVQNQHGQFVQNINCTGNHQSKSCHCPHPYPYVVYGIIGGLGLLSLITLTV
ncbi:hypothetical protein KUTeg_019456, partial [Tegillarca granosa]